MDDEFDANIDWDAIERQAFAALRERKAEEANSSRPSAAATIKPAISQLQFARRKPNSPHAGSAKRQAIEQPGTDLTSAPSGAAPQHPVIQPLAAPPRQQPGHSQSWRGPATAQQNLLQGFLPQSAAPAALVQLPAAWGHSAQMHGPQNSLAGSQQSQQSNPRHLNSVHARPQACIGNSQQQSHDLNFPSTMSQSATSVAQPEHRDQGHDSASSELPRDHAWNDLTLVGSEREMGDSSAVAQAAAARRMPASLQAALPQPQGKGPRQQANPSVTPHSWKQWQSASQAVVSSLQLQNNAAKSHSSQVMQPSQQGHNAATSRLSSSNGGKPSGSQTRSVISGQQQGPRQPLPLHAPRPLQAAGSGQAGRACLQQLWRKIQEFKQVTFHLPPPPPSHAICPGVFKHGKQSCGARLQFGVRHVEVSGQNNVESMPYYRCSSPDCDYSEAVPSRKMLPQFSFEAVSADVFKVSAAQGGKEAMHYCGGLHWVLTAIDCSLASAQQHMPSGWLDSQDLSSLDSISLDFSTYEDTVARLTNQKRLQMKLVERDALIPDTIIRTFRQPAKKCTEAEVEKGFAQIPKPLGLALMPFQRDGVMFGLRQGGRALIADEMGVGKTIQAIALATCYQEEWPLLVVVPASLRLVWAEELERWLPHMRPSSIHIIYGKSDRLPSDHDYKNCMAAGRFKVVIADESHTLRTTGQAPDSRHTEATVAACKKAMRAILLTGTPSLSRPFDLFRQIDALRPGLIGKTREAFSSRYCNRHLVPVGKAGEQRLTYSNNGLSRAGELHTVLKQEVMLRRLKAEVMAQLPPKRRQVVRMPAPQAADWPQSKSAKGRGKDEDEVMTDGSEQEEESLAEDDPENWSGPHKTGIAKLPNVIEWLAHALNDCSEQKSQGASQAFTQSGQPARQKMLIFAHHRDVMNKLASALEGQNQGFKGAKYVRIDGSSDPQDRRLAVNQFRDDPSVSVALLSVTAAGVGLDFSKATSVVFAELPDEVAHVRQAEDRAHRKGQQLSVNVYFLLAKGTTDERKWQRLNNSLERVTAIQDGSQAPGGESIKDSSGIILDALHEVSSSQGWLARMTQLPPGLPLVKPKVDPAGAKSSDLIDLTMEDSPRKSSASDSPGGSGSITAISQASLHSDEAEEKDVSHHEAEKKDVSGHDPTKVPAASDLQEELGSEVCFEVSSHTGRVHFHLAADGSQPLGLSLPLELLQMEGDPATIHELLTAVDNRSSQASHVGPAGVLAIPPEVTRMQLEAMIGHAKEFAREWSELRAVLRNRLHRYCLRAPLKEIADEVQSKAAEDGAYGQSTSRYLDAARNDVVLPQGAEWLPVKVKYYGRSKLQEHRQPFIGRSRLCCLCAKPVSWCSLPKEAILAGGLALFCSPDCEARFSVRTNGGTLRRELFRLERGVCQACKLDCHDLVKTLRAIEKGSHKWEFARRKKLLAKAPLWGARGAGNAAARLVKQVLDGNAWQADHIVPVYKGGGMCDLDNLRTLCTVCHQEVTKAQAKERAAARKLEGQSTLDAFLGQKPAKKGAKVRIPG